MTHPIPAGAGLLAAGRRQWQDILDRDPALADEHNPDRNLAVEACRLKDQIDQLHRLLRAEGMVVDGKVHPAAPEINRCRQTYKQLMNMLRLPDPETGERPQRRPGPGGVKAPDATKSSRERLRAI